MSARLESLRAIHEECKAQVAKWGEQNHGNTRWYTILGEEVGEVAKAILEGDPAEHLVEELTQVAAVCVSWVEAIGRRQQEDYEVSFTPGPGRKAPITVDIPRIQPGDAVAGYPVIDYSAVPAEVYASYGMADMVDEGHLVLADG